ncbi:heterokaryon incompatibility protein-domain-containing protein [Xylaria palmicola]|nr:heterokaryon incompatibility protein-domain-containing protein [Xylaria palmicola]
MSGAYHVGRRRRRRNVGDKPFDSGSDNESPERMSREEIRIAELLPAEHWDSPIRVEIHSKLELMFAEYEAVSYTWVGQSQTERIFRTKGTTATATEYHLLVTPSVAEGLRALRHTHRSRLIWIDALCINRDRHGSEATQSALIGNIFKNAARTILWAGPQNTHTGIVFSLFSELNSAREKALGAQINMEWKLDSARSPLAKLAEFGDRGIQILQKYNEAIPPPSWEHWSHLDELLDRPVFRRAWLVTEVAASNGLILQVGSFDIVFNDFYWALEGYAILGSPNSLYSNGIVKILNAASLRQSCRNGNVPRLVQVLDTIRGLSMARAGEELHLAQVIMKSVRDSRLSQWDLTGYATAALELNRDVAVYPVSLSRAGQSLSSGASWIPNWSSSSSIHFLNNIGSTFDASGSSQRLPYIPSGDSQLLILHGATVDRIRATSHYLPCRRLEDRYKVASINSIVFLEWFDWAAAELQAAGEEAKTLQDYVETIQAKGCDLWPDDASYPMDRRLDDARCWLEFLKEENGSESWNMRYFHAGCQPSYGRRLAISSRGYLCLVPEDTRRNDVVCIPSGSKVPFIFAQSAGTFENKGECYLHGGMHGEALTWDGVQRVKFDIR